MEVWGRIAALSSLSGHIAISALLDELNNLERTEAWLGAASVWTHPENIKKHREQCLTGIEVGLTADSVYSVAVAKKMKQLMYGNRPDISIPVGLVRLFFAALEYDNDNNNRHLFGFDEWLNATSHHDPDQALAAAEVYLAYASRNRPYIYDHDNNLTQLMTRLFAEAEEREESDRGAMLQRVVLLQDILLSLGVDSVNDWLKAAERP